MEQRRILAAVLLAALTAACSSNAGMTSRGRGAGMLPQASANARGSHPALAAYIGHVVIIVQENRSFDNLFAGYPGADTRMWGYNHLHQKVRFRRIALQHVLTLNHDYSEAWAAYDGGKMDGFDLGNFASTGGAAGRWPYTTVYRTQTAPYWSMARQYVLADHMFPTMLSASFTAHLDLIAGTTDLNPTHAVVDVPSAGPWGCDAPQGTTVPVINARRRINPYGPFPCFTQFRTMADVLDAAGISWKYYAPFIYSTTSSGSSGGAAGGLWSVFDAVSSVRYGPDWSNVVSPPTKIFSDVASGALPQVSWVIPDWLNSDHSWNGSDTGPSWVSSIVNAIGESAYWNSTVVFIVWDDWGGFYDNVAPPQLDFRGLGIRVPCLILSPYARQGYVDHTQLEFGSILNFIEQVWGLPTIGSAAAGYTDARAAAPLEAFNFYQAPRSFTPIAAPYPESYFLRQRPSGKPVDTE